MFTSSYGAFEAYACCIQMLYEKILGELLTYLKFLT